MGDPKKQRKKFEKPFKLWDKKRMEKERELLKKYGLRRKKEIWRMESILRKFRRIARELAAEENSKKEKELLNKLKKLGLIKKEAGLDDVLDLKIEDILNRRLQTLIVDKNLVNTPLQSRQFVVHGHVEVDERKIKWPSFLVPKELENKIKINIKK